MMRTLAKIVALLAVLGVLTAVGGYALLLRWADHKVTLPKEAVVELKPGASLAAFSAELSHAGVVSSARVFHLWVKLNNNYQHYQAGKYRFEGQVSPADIAATVIKGDVYNPVVVQITVPEGFTTKLLAERLAANGIGHIVEIQHLMTDATFLAQLKVPSTSLEGYIYPATYDFHEMPTAMQALETMVKTFWEKLPKDYEKNCAEKGITLADAVKFASLIELETRQDDEKPLISEVIWRRLKDKTPLAIDAALIYGIPDYAGALRSVHLIDAKNPYNTRVHQGLPPTPIGSPDTKALEAVLTPSNFGYYYYVLVAGTGRHHFSKTLAEHNANVRKFVNATKQMKKQ